MKKKLTFPQRNILSMHNNFVNTAICNVSFELQCSCDSAKMQEIIDNYVEKNNILKTRIVREDNEYFICSNETFIGYKLNMIDEKEVHSFRSKSLDIFSGEMARFALFWRAGKLYIIVCVHHIVSDAMSAYLICNDLHMMPLREQNERNKDYFDYMKEEDDYLTSKRFERDKQFWEEKLFDKPVLASITKNKVRMTDVTAKRKIFEVPEETNKAIEKIKEQYSCTVFDIFLAALSFYVSNINNNSQFVTIGTTALNRKKEYLNTIGMFVNVMPMIMMIHDNTTITEYMDYIRKTKDLFFYHHKYPYNKVMEYVYSKHEETKLFDVMLSYQPKKIILMDKEIDYDWCFNDCIETNLNVHILDRGEDIEINYDYKTNAFSEWEISKLSNGIFKIIQELSGSPDLQLRDIEVVTSEDKKFILNEFNKNISKNVFVSIPKLIKEQCVHNKEQTAVVYRNHHISYGELWNRSARLAMCLQEMGMHDNDVVGIMVGRNDLFVIAILGILINGGTYLPLENTFPKKRKDYIIEDSNMKYIVVMNREDDLELPQVCMNEVLSKEKYEDGMCNFFNTDRVAYILYTSGSTGRPKGVKIKQSSVVNLINGLEEAVYKGNTHMNVGVTASFLFDASVQQIYAGLLLGNTLHIIPEEEKKDGKSYLRYIRESGIDVLDMTPSHLRMLVEGNYNGIDEIGPSRLLVGGEALKTNSVRDFLDIYHKNPPELFNVYGPTECCVDSTYYQIDDINAVEQDIIPIGRPLLNVNVYILDEAKKLLPVGQTGELYISGLGVADGYVNLESENRYRFIPDMFHEGYTLYRTGDIGRFNEKGIIEYIERIDGQVKIRGYRVELGEIENTICKQNGVDAAVVTVTKEEENKKIVCFLHLSKETLLDQVCEGIAQELPGYMMPERFVLIDSIPLTSNGKTDSNKLLELLPHQKTYNRVQAESELEEKLLEIWRKVLNNREIGVTDNFFDCGGHSLNMTSLIVKIDEEFHIEVPWNIIYEKSDVKSIAEYIKTSDAEDHRSIGKAEGKENHRISSTQRRMYLAQQMDAGGISNNCPVFLEVEGHINEEKIKKALQQMTDRHEALRTVFQTCYGEVVQIIKDKVEVPLIIGQDFSTIDQLAEEFIKPFHLEEGPLIRAQINYVTDNRSILSIDMHHIVTDGESLKILLQELAVLYNGGELPEVKFQYKDFSEWQETFIKTGGMEKQEAYWLKLFKTGIPGFKMPMDYNRPIRMTSDGKTINSVLNHDQLVVLKSMAQEHNMTLFMLLLTAYAFLIYKLSESNEFVIGVPVAARTHSDLQDIVGYFVNMLPLKIEINKEKANDLFGYVKKRMLELYENQDYPCENLIMNLEHGSQHVNPMFQTCFTNTIETDGLYFEGNKAESIYPEYASSKFDFMINLIHRRGEIVVSFSYSTQIYREETASIMINTYLSVLNHFITTNSLDISDMLQTDQEESFEF